MKNSDYWKQRFAQLEKAQNAIGASAYAKIERQYKQAQRQIETQIESWYQRFAKNNGITLAEARQWLTEKELKEFQWDVREYIKHGEEYGISGKWAKELENASAKFHISKLEALKIQTQQSLESLFGSQQLTLFDEMGKVYKSGYYHTAFELQRGFNIGGDIAGVNQSEIEKILAKPWAPDKYNFSERIWKNKAKLINEVHKELTRNILTGADPQKAINAIAKKMNASKYSAGRLVMTEEAYFSSVAQRDCFNELDVEQYEIVATLDSHTSEICQELDGKHFPMKDYQAGVTAPPFHVFCRSTTVPYFDDNFGQIGQRAARDEETGKTYYVPDNMTYKDWKQAFVDGGSKEGLTNLSECGIIKVESDDVTAGMIEKEREYGVPYGADAIKADMRYIDSEEFAVKFNRITDIPSVNNALLMCSRNAISHRSGTLYEDMYLINGNTGEIMANQLNSNCERGIIYNESIKNAIIRARAENIPIIVFHSHPEGYPPSIDDFNSAYKNGYAFGVVAGHNGQVYKYQTPLEFIEYTDDIQEEIVFLYKGGVDIDRAYTDILRSRGLSYEIVKE